MQTLPKIEETLIAVIKTLPTEKQQALLEFAEFLQTKTASKSPSKSIKGLWAKADINLTEEELSTARKEMWANLPQEHWTMSAVVADTHTIIWYLRSPEKLSTNAVNALDNALNNDESIFISAISIVEIN